MADESRRDAVGVAEAKFIHPTNGFEVAFHRANSLARAPRTARLEDFLKSAEPLGFTVLIAGVRTDLLDAMGRLQFSEWLPDDRVFPQGNDEDSPTLAAIRSVYERLGGTGACAHCLPKRASAASGSKLYYLVYRVTPKPKCWVTEAIVATTFAGSMLASRYVVGCVVTDQIVTPLPHTRQLIDVAGILPELGSVVKVQQNRVRRKVMVCG